MKPMIVGLVVAVILALIVFRVQSAKADSAIVTANNVETAKRVQQEQEAQKQNLV